MQMVVVLSFVMRLLDFVKKIHVNQQLLDSAKEAATHRAVETVSFSTYYCGTSCTDTLN